MKKPVTNLGLSELFAQDTDLGHSHWVRVDQQMITKFGEATLDPDPMHIDPDWSEANSPYGGTIAYGFLTSSLLTHLLYGALKRNLTEGLSKQGHVMNYGMDHLRFISPVPVNSRIRGHFKVIGNITDKKGRNVVRFACEVNIKGEKKPALVAEWLGIFIPQNQLKPALSFCEEPREQP